MDGGNGYIYYVSVPISGWFHGFLRRFEEKQVLKFSIYDWDGKSANLKAHDFLGKISLFLLFLKSG
jgi:hypothetical protein